MTGTSVPVPPSAVYLDEPFTNALVVLGYNEGFVSSYTGGASDYERTFLSTQANPDRAQVALQQLVLFGRAILSPFDNFTVENAEAKRFIQIAQPAHHQVDPEMKCPVDRDEIEERGLLYPVLSLLRSQGVDTSSDELMRVIDRIPHYNTLLWERFERGAVGLILRDRKLGKRNQARLAELDDVARNVVPIFSALGRVSRLTRISEQYQCPALWDCPAGARERWNENVSEDQLVVAAVYFRKLRNVRVQSLSDALQLIQHKAIESFRGEVAEMIERVQSGRATKDDIEHRIDFANRALKAADLEGPAGRWMTILGLPALVIPPLGVLLTLAGVSVLGASAVTRHHLGWALVSNTR